MAVIRNTELELHHFRLRLAVTLALIALCLLVLFARFFYLQVIRYDKFSAQAEENRISVVPVPPGRGLIIDRNGVVLARNYSAYTLEIMPSRVPDLEATIDALSKLVTIEPRDRRRFKKAMDESKSFESLPIRTRLSDEEVARFAAQRFRFPGVEIKARLFRQYPEGMTAAHVLGYIGRISQSDQERIEDSENSSNYRGTEYIGKEGLEKRYETQLHGTTGIEEVEVSAGGKPVRTLKRTNAVPGNNLILSLDIKLQKIAEAAFGDRRGALVAIEPSTGDVLAFVSNPSFDPNLFVDGIDQANWDALNNSEDKPLINRPLTGLYPIGSTYKPFMALAGLELGKRRIDQAMSDPGYFMFGSRRFNDDAKGGHGMVDVVKSIAVSCDTYYYQLANDLGIDAIHDFMKPFSFGQLTGIDLDGEKRGILPSPAWKERAFKKPEQQKWYAGETISIGIGQGYNSFSILQLAHATGILANNGVVMKPHLVKSIEDISTGKRTLTTPSESARLGFKPEHMDAIKRGMIAVNVSGTAARVFAGAQYVTAGKTGTAQLFGLKANETYVESRVAARLRDHSLYMAFAPADNPKIALAVIVENGGFGARAAAPIARIVFDYWLTGKKPDEQHKRAQEIDSPEDGPQ